MPSLNTMFTLPTLWITSILATLPTQQYNGAMAIQATTEALLALELFQLDPSRKKSRKLLNQHIVQVAMFEHEDARSLSEITTAVSEVLEQHVVLTHDECREALLASCKTERVLQSGEDNYILAEETKKIQSGRIKIMSESEREFERGLADSVGRKLGRVLDPFAEAVLSKTVKEAIQNIFYRNALRLRRLLDSDGQRDFSVLIETDSDTESELKQQLETFLSLQTNATIENTVIGIQWAMGNLNEVQKHYVASLHHKVLYFQMLNIDPRLQKLEAECFSRIRLYLDTNVVIRYLCEGYVVHQAILDILDMSKAMGVKLFVSSKTLREAERLVEEAKSHSVYLSDPPISAILQVNPEAVLNPIIKTFLAKRKGNPQLNWAGFISPFTDLETYLLSRDIEVSDDHCGDLTVHEAYSRVRAAMIDAKGEDTHIGIIDHDTYNLILVQQLRNNYPSTPLGASVWLITIDRKLPMADKILHGKYSTPHCRQIDKWGVTLLPFQSVGKLMATDEYVSWLVSHKLGAIFPEEELDLTFFKDLEKADIGVDDFLNLDPELAFKSLSDLQQDREAKTLLSRIPDSLEGERESIKSEFREKVLGIISKRGEEDVEQDKKEIARLQSGIDELTMHLRQMGSSKAKDKESIELLRRKLETVKSELKQYESMPFWQRIKYILRGRER